MKSYFELAVRTNPRLHFNIVGDYFRLNNSYAHCWYAVANSETLAKKINDEVYLELITSYRDGCHRYWRRYK